MLFNSFDFLIFFPTVTLLYFIIPFKYRWFLLLTASSIFYMAFIPVYILILAITIIIDYIAGIWIEKLHGIKKKLVLALSIISTCLVLFVFKYFNFINASFAGIADLLDLRYPVGMINIILPVGLSFHTFQSLSYVIEVYRGKQKAEKHFGIYSLYVMFYPQLVAGPIERPQNLLYQFRIKHIFEYQRVTDGLKLVLWGFFKKIVIADRAALIVNCVYGDAYNQSGLTLLLATLFFAVQIYCDFSGYSDIAIGVAQVMGFKLMDNFNRPYYAKTISEFWKRWHISLSTWFKDYVYIALGGNKVPLQRWLFNLFITFTISGLWHGANWTYVVWGALNGFYLIFAILTNNLRANIARITGILALPRLYKIWQIVTTFSLISFSWIFFRAKDLSEALHIVKKIFTDNSIRNILFSPSWMSLSAEMFKLGNSKIGLIITLASIGVMELFHMYQRHGQFRQMLRTKHIAVRYSVYLILFYWILAFGEFDGSSFIYFQF